MRKKLAPGPALTGTDDVAVDGDQTHTCTSTSTPLLVDAWYSKLQHSEHCVVLHSCPRVDEKMNGCIQDWADR